MEISEMQKIVLLLFVVLAMACAADSNGSASRLFGKWVISKSLDSTAVSALSSGELEAMIGKTLFLRKGGVDFEAEDCGDSELKFDYVSKDKLLQEIRYADSQNPLLPNKVTQVDAGCMYIYERTDGSILLVWGGDIFVAERAAPIK